MSKKFRSIQNDDVQDPSSIAAVEYNKYSGSQKVSEVGRRLKPIPYVSGSSIAYTTDVSTARVVDPGACLAIYNNDTAIHSITLGESSAVVSLAAGDTDSSGHVGVPCPAGEWTYLAVGTHPWMISDSNLLIVLVIEDSTIIRQEFINSTVV